MRARLLNGGEHDVWDRWLRTVSQSNIRQTSVYARALRLYGHRPEILVVERDGTVAAGALLGIRPTAPGIGPTVQVSGGVALADPGDAHGLEGFLDALLERCREVGACTVELALRVPVTRADSVGRVLGSRRFRRTGGLGTYCVDLEVDSEDALLRGFGKNPRRHIRKAAREGLTVEIASEAAVFEEFEATHRQMCRRKGIVARPRGFAGEVLLPLAKAGLGDLFVASFAGVPRNYLFTGAVGEPVYLWGAIADAAREPGCPQTGQALHFRAMCHYRSRGKRHYDFGGAPGREPDPAHPNFSVWKFKHEFGGRFVEFAGSWTRNLRPLRGALLRAIKRAATRAARLTS